MERWNHSTVRSKWWHLGNAHCNRICHAHWKSRTKDKASHNDLSSSNRDSSLDGTNPQNLHSARAPHIGPRRPSCGIGSLSICAICQSTDRGKPWCGPTLGRHARQMCEQEVSLLQMQTHLKKNVVDREAEQECHGMVSPVHHLHAAKSNASPLADLPTRAETVGNTLSTRRPVTSINLDIIELRWT